MRQLMILFFLMLFKQILYGQASQLIFSCSYSANENAETICSSFQIKKFSDNQQANRIVSKILSTIGLPKNFILYPCSNIKNAIAVIPEDGLRYIIYDNDFMNSIDNVTSKWSSMSILAHEIGHHLSGHTIKKNSNLIDQRRMELEADEFSGFIMYKLGATLNQSLAAIKKVSVNHDDTYSTHPSLSKRINAITSGFNKAKEDKEFKKQKSDPSVEQYFNEALELINRGFFKESILKSDTALTIDPRCGACYHNRGVAKDEIKNYYGAIEDYTNAINSNISQPSEAFRNRGVSKHSLGNYKGAILDYSEAIRIDITDYIAFNNRAISKTKLEDYYGAIADYNIALSLNSNYATAYTGRGNARGCIDDLIGARTDLKKACDLGDELGCKLFYENFN